MQYFALIEEWPGESMLYLREWPGCVAARPTSAEALAVAPEAIAAHRKWLKKEGLAPALDAQIEVVVKERIAMREGQQGPRFEADLAPPDDVEIDYALNVAAAAHADLIQLYDGLSEEERERAPRPGEWSVKDHMLHVVEAEDWYVTRLSGQPERDVAHEVPFDLCTILFDVAMDAEAFLRAFPVEERGRIFLRDGEEWTMAKALRRMVGHLREHLPWIEAIVEAQQA